MYTQIETTVKYEKGDKVKCNTELLHSFTKHSEYIVDNIEIDYKGDQNLIFYFKPGISTIVAAKHFSIVKRGLLDG